jgi:dihydroneopterin aldolase
MLKLKKIIIRAFFVLLILIPVAALAHFIIFPQQSRAILIDYSGFKKDGRLYFNTATPQNKTDSLKTLIEQANTRVTIFWGDKKSDPKFIYCDNKTDFTRYSSAPAAPAITYLKLGSYIVLSADALDLDIIAHEISHAEFYARVGFYTWSYKIPAWFKHGLAMQNDYRNYYSEDTLKVKSNNFKNLPDIKKIKKDDAFYAGTHDEVMLNYMTARHEFKNWYTKKKLETLIKDLNSGKSFEEAFVQ